MAIRKTVGLSLNPAVLKAIDRRANELGVNRSAYLNMLVSQDLTSNPTGEITLSPKVKRKVKQGD